MAGSRRKGVALARALAIAAVCWLGLLGAAVALRAEGRAPLATTSVYLAASLICHQRPARSFWTDNVQWPVCARCAGLYLAAPLGALAALGRFGRRRERVGGRLRLSLAAACLPTAATLVVEWSGLAPVTNLARALAALPAGAAIAFAIVEVAAGSPGTDQVN